MHSGFSADKVRQPHPDLRRKRLFSTKYLLHGVSQRRASESGRLGRWGILRQLHGRHPVFRRVETFIVDEDRSGSFAPIAAGQNAILDTGSLGYGGNTFTFAHGISGDGGLTKIAAGTLTLTAANTYTGTTTITAGTLQLGDGTTNGSIAGTSIVNNATLIFNVAGSTTQTYSGTISGNAGAVIKSSAGKLILTGANSYTGLTTVGAGTLEFGANAQNVAFNLGGVSVGKAILVFDYNATTSPLSSINTAIAAGKISSTNTGDSLVWAKIDDGSSVTLAKTVNGDSNLDFICDGADLNTVLSNYNAVGNWFAGNFNGDAKVDGADLNIVLSNYNKGVTAATAAVPEPSTLLLAASSLIGLVAYALRRR